MNIAMFTNLYLPLVGGVQRSIATFKREFEQRGHRVLVVTPVLEGEEPDDPGVVRVPAIQNFNGSDFSVAIPIPGYLHRTLDNFTPDLVHAHHPFLLGATALRAATKHNRPLVFTYHTMWEHYVHYTLPDSPTMQAFVKRMAAEYCNLCDHVIAPCKSIAEILRHRKVTTPITVVPTGINTDRFKQGDRTSARKRLGIPPEALVAGYVGRLGLEKNLRFVTDVLAMLCAQQTGHHALLVGNGELDVEIRQKFRDHGLADRLHMPGTLQDQELVDAYHALDVFVFASRSETQGLVLAEAMAAGCPVVALDAPGADDIVADRRNGRLLREEDVPAFVEAIRGIEASREARSGMRRAAMATSERWSSANSAKRAMRLYEAVVKEIPKSRALDDNGWSRMLRRLETEWNLWTGRAAAAAEATANGSRPV
jgi:glycosyltransferase involved in cell wall biosynthesis